MKRKFFAAFLSLCMVMSLVPMTALGLRKMMERGHPAPRRRRNCRVQWMA